MDNFTLTIVGIVGSTVGSAIFVFFIEKMRMPVLRMEIEHPPLPDLRHDPNSGLPALRQRVLRLVVENRPLWWPWKWILSRHTATDCLAQITFHHLDGQNFLGRTMAGRWARSPQPIPMFGMIGNQRLILFDQERINQISRVNIRPAERTELDIAVRFDQDQDAFGWTNASYHSNPPWRNPDWQLPRGRYLVRARVTSSNGGEGESIFRLINDVPIEDFRLENPQRGDVAT